MFIYYVKFGITYNRARVLAYADEMSKYLQQQVTAAYLS